MPRAGLATSRSDDADGVTRPIKIPRSLRPRRPARLWRPADRRPGGPRLARGAARSLLVTPWFAAGTGFVIAAGLWVYSPHTVLRFPSGALNDTPCKAKGCGVQPSGPTSGSLAVTTPGVTIQHAESGDERHGKPDLVNKGPIAGLRFDFSVIWQRRDSFSALITVSGNSLPRSWRLSFSIPGVLINYVAGADWQPSANGDGGTASLPSPLGGDPAASARIRLTLGGTGTANMPANCEFDGYSCTFG